jgi:hypothetical protein
MEKGEMFRDGVAFALYTTASGKLWLRPKQYHEGWQLYGEEPKQGYLIDV